MNRTDHVRVEGEGDPILFIPGVDQEAFRTSEFSRYIRWQFRDVEREMIFASRPYTLPDDVSTAGMAEGYMDIIEEEEIREVAGVSLGGMIAQHVAARKDLEKLLIGFSGLRLSGEGRERVERWEELLEENRKGIFYSRSLKDAGAGRLLPVVARFMHPIIPSSPMETIRASVNAALKHDACGEDVRAQEALVVGADNDLIFSPEVVRELSNSAEAKLRMVEGGHAAFRRRSEDFNSIMNGFFS